MKKVNSETKYNVLQEIGKLFDLKVVGVKGEVLIGQINEKIDSLMAGAKKPGKWYENTELPFKEGDIVDVTAGWAEGWQVQIVKPSAKVNAFKARRYNPKSGDLQGTLVTIDVEDMVLYTPHYPILVAEVV
ncbi:hypothetical protein D3C87_574140 [compost metagenome]